MEYGRLASHPAIKNDLAPILRFFETALVSVRFNHPIKAESPGNSKPPPSRNLAWNQSVFVIRVNCTEPVVAIGYDHFPVTSISY
jgi:hypothetical protein